MFMCIYHVHVHMHVHVESLTTAIVGPNLIYHALLMPKHWEVMFGDGSEIHVQKWITILFIYPGLSVNHCNNQS